MREDTHDLDCEVVDINCHKQPEIIDRQYRTIDDPRHSNKVTFKQPQLKFIQSHSKRQPVKTSTFLKKSYSSTGLRTTKNSDLRDKLIKLEDAEEELSRRGRSS